MSQKKKILNILKDYEPHSTFQICDTLFPGGRAGLFRLGARIFELRRDGYAIDGWQDKQNPQKYWYLLCWSPEEARIEALEYEA